MNEIEESDDFELIQKFLFEELSEEEKVAFKKKFTQDQAFADEVRSYTDIVLSVSALEKLESLEVPQEKNRLVSIRHILLGVAASLFFLLGILVIYNLLQPKTNTDLYQAYYQPYDAPKMSLRSDSSKHQLQQAVIHYREGNYEKSLSLFETERLKGPASALLLFYLGQCYLNTDQTEEAITAFKQVVTMDDIDFSALAHWYLALAYLKNDELGATRKLLDEIVLSKQAYQKEAVQLLEALDQIQDK